MTPYEMRRQIMSESFVPYVKGVFAKHPKIKSAMLAVAQYWADEADDAVHATVVFSERETPLWPHNCYWGDDERPANAEHCSSCGHGYGWMPFDDNGDAITAFQSCCREDASQESETAEAYLPYAVARRGAAEPSVEIVGGPIRFWLDEADAKPAKAIARDAASKPLFDLVYASRDDDGPRQVLADHLQQVGNPLGEYIALSLTKQTTPEIAERRVELELAHAREWIGPLAEVVPPEQAVFARGFLRRATVRFADEAVAERVLRATEWGTVEVLRFLPEGVQRLAPTMRSLRDVGPLDGEGLAELLRVGASLPIERAHVLFASDKAPEELAKLDIPTLRCLVIGTTEGAPGRVTREARNPFTGEMMSITAMSPAAAEVSPKLLSGLLRARSFERLDELVVASLAAESVRAWLARPANARPKTLTFTGVTPSYDVGGLRLSVRDDLAIVDMPSFGGGQGIEALAEAVSAVPAGVRVVWRATPLFAPLASDIAELARLARRPVDAA